MKPERIQIWAHVIDGARSIASRVWGFVKAVCGALVKFCKCLLGC